MPKASSSVVLPRLNLTEQDVTELRSLATALDTELLKQYEDFTLARHRKIDKIKWRHLKTEGNVSIYQERRSGSDQLGFMSSSPRKCPSTEPQASLASGSSNQRLLLAGKIPGTLDDAMYGSCFDDTASLRISEAYRRNFLDDSAVLAAIDAPTPDDPFRFLGVSWHLRGSRLTKARDALLLRSTKLSTLSTGERIGLRVSHSVAHRDLSEFLNSGIVRVNISAVAVFRQLSVEHVEAFGIEFMDEKRVLDAVQQQEAVRDLLLNVAIFDSASKKKLHWLIRRRYRQSRSSEVDTPHVVDLRRCALCMKSTSGLFAASGASCQLCTKHVCSRCMLTHDIVVDASTSNVVAKPFGFCIECLLRTKKTPTIEIARAEVASNLRNSSRQLQLQRSISPGFDKRRDDSPPIALC